MPKVTDEYRAARRDEIANAAMEAFRRKGFQATSMADIMEQAGLSAGAIYNQYKGKAEIVHEVARRLSGLRLEDVSRLALTEPMPPPAELVRTLVSAVQENIGDARILVQVWGEAVTDPEVAEVTGRVFTNLINAYSSYLTQWHVRVKGVASDEAARLGATQAPLVMSAIQGFFIQSALMPGFSSEAYLASMDAHLPR